MKGGVLTIPVNGVYFDQIASGDKPEEYRLVTPYWLKRLNGRHYRSVVLTRGYPKGGGIEGVTRLTRRYAGFEIRRITHPHFGAEPVMVFAINVAQGMETRQGEDPQGLRAEHDSPVAESDAPNLLISPPDTKEEMR